MTTTTLHISKEAKRKTFHRLYCSEVGECHMKNVLGGRNRGVKDSQMNA